MTEICQYCQAYYFKKEKGKGRNGKYTKCCYSGTISLPIPAEPPQTLVELYNGENIALSQEFLQNVRTYNNSLAFASFDCKLNHELLQSYPYCFRIHGQVYNQVSTLHPPPDASPRFSQIYIFDTAEASRERENQAAQFNLNRHLLMLLHTLLREHNPFAAAYYTTGQIEQAEIERARQQNVAPRRIFMKIRADRTPDPRRYNQATANEIAAVFTSEDGLPPSSQLFDIVIYPRPRDNPRNERERRGLCYMQRMNPNCDPMMYPLLFPYGEQGWQGNIPRQNYTGPRSRVTPMKFYSYKLQIRANTFPTLHYARKLFHQYIVDAYTKMEGERLAYIRNHQKDLRVDQYQGLMDYVGRPEQEGRAGNPYILPSNFPGGKRNFQERFQDSMAIVREFGKPDLFITITCNPRWPEITSALLPGQSPGDRPDIVCRVFAMKLEQIMDDILKGQIFGVVVAHVYVIEFQKRGLPHCHLLLILHPSCKFDDSDKVDKVICAEIPSRESHPNLYEAVASHMMHGPCGPEFPACPCMLKKGVCDKKFPKPFQERTHLINDGFPIYQRRDSQEFVVRKNTRLDNRWVVPYNKYLLMKYNCHINVELCATLSALKYLTKYIYKGHDCAHIEIIDSRDEILNYLNARYVSATEAVWRIFSYSMHDQSHTIVRLAVHLENLQPVFFEDGREDEALQQARDKDSTLTAWFKLNQRDPDARRFSYADTPLHYRWNRVSRSWDERIYQTKTIGRMYFVSPREGERFFLRTLLIHIKGATSFDDLRTFDGTVYNTFREAAIARGIASTDDEWDRTLNFACSYAFPAALRSLFVTICIYCNPGDCMGLFDKYVSHLSEDFARTHSAEVAREMCLAVINEKLQALGSSNVSIGLPPPDDSLIEEVGRCAMLEEVAAVPLNDSQQVIYDAVMSALNDSSNRNRYFFVDGPGGSGKTFLYKKICQSLQENNIKYLCVASTGIAATLLPNGRTAHSTFKLPLSINESSVCKIGYNTVQARRIRDAQLIIWDEATMASGDMVRCANNCVADLCKSTLFFGGKVVLLGGDFRQCLPVVRGGSRVEIVENSINKCSLWLNFQTFSLTRNMRADSDPHFASWLLDFGGGSRDDIAVIPQDLISSGDIIEDTFGHDPRLLTAEYMKNKCILSPKNTDILKLNEDVLDKLQGAERVFLSTDSVDVEEGEDPTVYTPEFLNSLTPSGMPPHRLRLKIGCIVILLRNIDPQGGLSNGTRLMVKGFEGTTILCSMLNNPSVPVILSRIELAPTDSPEPYTLRRRQYPIRLAYAMTINKSQGQTFDRIGLYLPQPVFSHGQLYVAFSRVKNRHAIKVFMIEGKDQGINQSTNEYFTQNIVYREIFV